MAENPIASPFISFSEKKSGADGFGDVLVQTSLPEDHLIDVDLVPDYQPLRPTRLAQEKAEQQLAEESNKPETVPEVSSVAPEIISKQPRLFQIIRSVFTRRK